MKYEARLFSYLCVVLVVLVAITLYCDSRAKPAEKRFRLNLYNTSLYKGVNTYSGWIETKRGDNWYGLKHVEWDEQLFKSEGAIDIDSGNIYIGGSSAYETTTGGNCVPLGEPASDALDRAINLCVAGKADPDYYHDTPHANKEREQ